MKRRSSLDGFTIVELLIVIIVIGILATLVLIAYRSVGSQANVAAAKDDLSQISKQLDYYKETSGSGIAYPADASGLKYSSGASVQYTVNNTVSPATYCVTVTKGAAVYYIDNTDSTVPAQGICPGQNLLAWDKAGGGAVPIPGAVVDSTTYHTSIESMRLGPNKTGVALAGNPYTGPVGAVYKVDLWVLTDTTWNGTSNNSKIRFGKASDGSLLQACGYGGVKASWTEVTCSYTLSASVTSVAITVGNDGTTGNVWLDDISVSRSAN